MSVSLRPLLQVPYPCDSCKAFSSLLTDGTISNRINAVLGNFSRGRLNPCPMQQGSEGRDIDTLPELWACTFVTQKCTTCFVL